MGKGDIKTRKGKITNGSFGKRRPHQVASKPDEVTTKAEKTSKK